jgi:hypothetical protein
MGSCRRIRRPAEQDAAARPEEAMAIGLKDRLGMAAVRDGFLSRGHSE